MSEAHPKARKPKNYPATPDGRYFVVRGMLWRRTNPYLPEDERVGLTKELMAARRAVRSTKRADNAAGEKEAHAAVDRAKRALGERGPVWWEDGTPDFNWRKVQGTPYAEWFAALPVGEGGD